MESSIVRDSMRRLPLFAGLDEKDLDRLLETSTNLSLRAGEPLFVEHEHGDTMYVIIEGEFEVVRLQGTQETLLAIRGPGDVVGEMALLQREPRSATVRARSGARLLVIDQDGFAGLLSCSPTAAFTILSTVTTRLRSTESMLMNQAKLAALGTMAAGLAHELNNPAAAIRRSADQLRESIEAMDAATLALAQHTLDGDESRALDALRRGAAPSRERSARDRTSRLEEEIESYLEGEAGVDEAWALAPALVASGWTVADLAEGLAAFTPTHRADVARWLGGRAAAHELLAEARLSAGAISDIVSAVKRYSYLDQAPIQRIDVHEGLETTLTIMKHKLREGTTVVRKYASDLPTIEALGSELNQVWTNLIDNAVGAIAGQGTITIRTVAAHRSVRVEIQDTGPGIPDHVLPRLFEPFFTTKGVGDGTGLGLHIAWTIVVNRHHGQIDVRSEPGATCFLVTLPVSLAGR